MIYRHSIQQVILIISTTTLGSTKNISLYQLIQRQGYWDVTSTSPFFISGQVRMRGKNGGRYPYHYLEMIDTIFGKNDNTIEVCNGNVKENCFSVDINPGVKPDLVSDGQSLAGISDGMFDRWRCDPPYNAQTARDMYGTKLPVTGKLLKSGARVCKAGSLMFLLLGPQNYQMCPAGVRRIGWIPISIVPNNEVRCLNICWISFRSHETGTIFYNKFYT